MQTPLLTFHDAPSRTLTSTSFATPLGTMFAIADKATLYLLEFADHPKLEAKVARLQATTHSLVKEGITAPLIVVKKEIGQYFAGRLTTFTTPLFLIGSPFQKSVWQELQKIPYGSTRSYGELARLLNKPTAFRAVGQANGVNPFPLIIPCHRVISSHGTLSGYSGGVERKQWLLGHEKCYKSS